MDSGMAKEKITVNLPQGFDPQRHLRALEKRISDTYGDGFEISSINVKTRVATASRQASITEVSDGEEDSFEVRLAKGTKPSDGEKVAIRLEEDYPGCVMTGFEPFLGKATLTKSSPETSRARSALSIALGVKPWDVQVHPRKDGGFELELPRSYVPSKHDDKLNEVATQVIGREGWFVAVNTQKLTATIEPSEPPTFPPALPYPFDRKVPKFKLGDNAWAAIPLGMKLPDPGETKGDIFYLDLLQGAHMQVGGISGGGKTVLINDYIAGTVARGAELVVVDLPSKSVDFLWCKPYCRPGGWGCNDLAAAVTSLALVMEEGERRAKVLAKHNVVNWQGLPPSMGDEFRPIVVVVDELTGLFYPEKVPKLAKDHPLVLEANEINLQKAMLEKYIKRIAAELRFVGVHLLISSQVASVATGIDPAMRTNLHHKVLMGAKPTEGNRRLVLSDPGRVPKVPNNVTADSSASRGTGSAEPEGQEPAVFKSFFAPTHDLAAWLAKQGIKENRFPEPTPSQIARLTPSLDDYGDQGKVNGQDEYSGGERAPSGKLASTLRKEMGDEQDWAFDPETGKRLTGNALANATRHAAVVTDKPSKPRSPDQNNPFASGDA
jgi:hypothetical protein